MKSGYTHRNPRKLKNIRAFRAQKRAEWLELRYVVELFSKDAAALPLEAAVHLGRLYRALHGLHDACGNWWAYFNKPDTVKAPRKRYLTDKSLGEQIEFLKRENADLKAQLGQATDGTPQRS